MRSLTWAVLAGVIVSATIGTASAQPGGGGRGGPGGFGFGGGRGGPGGELMILGMPEVQKELSITDDQKALVEDMMADLREGGGQRPDFASFRDLSEEERNKRFEEMRKQGEARVKQAEEAVKAILDEKQFARYEELRLQRAGVMALSRPEVADKLALTQEQKDKLAELRPQGGGRGGPGGRGPGGPGGQPGGEGNRPPRGEGGERPDFQAMMAQMRERQAKMEADTLAVLTPEQKTKWESMLGKKFEFPAPQFGGRGPGGPGGQPGGAPGQRPPTE